MSHIYTQARTTAGTNLSALAIGTLSIAAVFALLPLLMQIQNPFEKALLKPVEDAPIQLPDKVIPDPPKTIIEPEKLEKPILEDTPPLVTLDQMASLLNPSNSGAGIYVDTGGSFLDGDATAFDTFAIGQLDQKPRVLVAASPVYPYSMQNSNTQGEVMVEFIIDQKGKVLRPRVVKSTHREFEQAALDAVTKSKWQPGRKDAKDVRTLVHLPIIFRP